MPCVFYVGVENGNAVMEEGSAYFKIGRVLGVIAAIITFLSAYIYCINEYGFLWGFGFGWIPSALLAALIGWAVYLLWGVVAALILLLIWVAIKG